MLACPFGPEWDLLVGEVGKFQAYKDYMQHQGEIRTPMEVKSKLLSEGILTSMYPAHQYQLERTPNTAPATTVAVFEKMAVSLVKKFPGHAYKLINDPSVHYKGYVAPIGDENSVEGKPTIVINTAKASLDTPLHEFGHIFLNFIRRDNVQLYFGLMNSVFDVHNELLTIPKKKGGTETVRNPIAYTVKEKYKEEWDMIAELYPELTEEERVEELLVELMGKHASTFYDEKTGEYKPKAESAEITSVLAKALKRIWDAIKNMLIPGTVQVMNISPSSRIEDLATILAQPDVIIEKGGLLPKIDEKLQEQLNKKLVEYQSLKEAVLRDGTFDFYQTDNYTYFLTKEQGTKFKNIEAKLGRIRAYVDTNRMQGKSDFYNDLVSLRDALAEQPFLMSTSEERDNQRLLVLDEPRFSKVKTILRSYPSDDINYFLLRLKNSKQHTDDAVIREASEEACEMLWGYKTGTRTANNNQFKESSILSQVLQGAVPEITRLFNMEPAAYREYTETIKANKDEPNFVINSINENIKDLKNKIENPTRGGHRSETVEISTKHPVTGEIVTDKVTISGSYYPQYGDSVSVDFSSNVWGMKDSFFIVPATKRNVRVYDVVHEGHKTYKEGGDRHDQRDAYVVMDIDGDRLEVLPIDDFFMWRNYDDMGRRMQAQQILRTKTEEMFIPELDIRVDHPGRSIQVMSHVIHKIAGMFSDVPYDSIKFIPMTGESTRRESGEERLKLYSSVFKKLLGKYSTLQTTDSSTQLVMPSWFTNNINLNQPVYQKDSAPDTINSFVEETEGSVDTLGIESIRGSVQSLDPKTIDNAQAVGSIKAFARALAGKLQVNGKSMNYQFIDAAEAQRITEGKKNPWNGEKAFFVGDTVYFVGDNLTLGDVFHEFAHPFVRSLALENPKLFNKLYNDLLKTPEGALLFEQVKAAYPDLDVESDLFKEEMIVRTLTESAKLGEQSIAKSSGLSNFLKDFLYAIKQMLRKMFGQPIKVSSLDVNTSIKDLATMLKEADGIILDERVLDEVDTVAYIKDLQSYMQDMARISKPELMGISVSAHDIALKHIDTVMRNKNYKEIASILADEFNRGDLQEIKRDLTKFAKPLEDKLREKRDEIEYNKAHTQALINTFFRLQNMTQKIKEHMKDLMEDPDSIDNLHKAFYYDYLLKYWEGFIDETVKSMLEADVPTDSPLFSLVNSIKLNIESSRKNTRKIYKTGTRDIIHSELRPMAEKIAEKYSKIINDLKKRNAPKKLIDQWTVEYYGLTDEELTRMNELEKSVKAGSITTSLKKEYDFLKRKSMDGAQITEEKIEAALNGELKDANVFSSFFEGYMYNSDPIVGGFALYVKNQMSDVINIAMGKFTDYVKDIKPLLEKAGYTPANVNDLIERIARKELIGKIDKDGKWVEQEVWAFQSAHKDWRIALDRLRRDIDEAHRNYSESGTTEDHEKLLNSIAAKKKLLRDYFHQEYEQAVYARDYLLEKDATGIEAAYRMDRIFEQMKEYNGPASSKTEEIDVSERIDQLWREYHQLFSFVDIDGKLKSDKPIPGKTYSELDLVKRLKEYREGAVDPNTGKSYYEWKLRAGVFENDLIKYEQEIALKFGVNTPEYDLARKTWIDKNTRVVIKPEFYEERKAIMASIEEIMSRIPDAERKSMAVSELWGKITDIVAGNRDDDGQPNGMNFTESGVKFVKDQQEKIQEALSNFAGLSGLNKSEAAELQHYWDILSAKQRKLTADEQRKFNDLLSISDNTGLSKLDKKKLFGLFAKLQGLQKKEATDYYVIQMNHQLSKLNTGLMMNELNTNNVTKESANLILEDFIINDLLKQSPDFEAWFKSNHIRKEVYDEKTKTRKEIWERLYIWNVVRPTDKNHYENISDDIAGMPSLKYYARIIKPQYRTEKIIGVTVDNQGNYLPRTDVPDSPYIDQDYLSMNTTRPADFAVLEKMKEHHLRNQEGLGYKARLYLDIPRYRKNALEVLRTKKFKAIAGDVGDKNYPMLQLLIERFKNLFRKAKDEKGAEYNWEDDAILVRADMFDNEVTSVPISGLYDLEIGDVSPDINQSLMRYMFSAERQKKLIEINPIAQALKETVNSPENLAKELDRINKFNYIHRGVVTYLNKKGKYTRQAAVNNFIEREFEGQVDAGVTKDMPWAQNATNMILGRASFAFFALNIPSALKNAIGAKWQSMVHSVGGIDVDPMSMAKGELWSSNTMGQISMDLLAHRRGVKTLNVQIADSFDAVRGRAEDKLPESMSRTMLHDVANLSWLMNFRKWTENQASMQLFAGMMYKQKVQQEGRDIYYMDAWEQVGDKLSLKAGIDVRWSNLPTEYIVTEGDTFESLAKKFNMSEENLEKGLKKSAIKVGKTITINNTEYKALRNRFHSVQMNLNGAYAKFDQPEAQRYLAFRFISFLKRYFTPMLVNRWGFSGTMMGAKRGRLNPGLGDIHEGYYVTVMKNLVRLVRSGGKNYPFMTPEEKAAYRKVVIEVLALIALTALLAPFLGWDPEDEDRFQKLKERSGNMPFFGLVPDDPEHPFNMGGWLMNHSLLLTLSVRAENESFIPWVGFGLDNYQEILTDVSSIGFGPTLEAYKKILEYEYMDLTGDKRARYAKDSGPYEWQKEGGSKAYTEFFKALGLSGGTLSPQQAIKNNPTLN